MHNGNFLEHINLEKPLNEVKNLIETDVRAAKTDSGFLTDVLTKYYRQPLPFDPDLFRQIDSQPVGVRLAIQNDPYWSRIGRFVHILDFSEKERLKFASEAEIEKIAIFLLFEKDLDVLDRVFNNATLPTKVLLDYINIIKERDIDREDDKILRLALKIFKRRSRRIIKAHDILRLAKTEIREDPFIQLITYVCDEDPLIRDAALNAVSSVPLGLVASVLQSDRTVERIRTFHPAISGIAALDILHVAVKHILRIHDTHAVMESGQNEKVPPAGVDLFGLLETRKLRELGRCVDDPTNLFNLGMLAFCHMDPKEEVQRKARDILAVEDILELAGDESTPRELSIEILRLLDRHPDEDVKARVQEIRLAEAERVNKRMKELEVSVNAYFDVVFQSLNYARINDQKEAVQILRGALSYVQQFSETVQQKDPGTVTVTQGFLRKAIEHYEGSINNLYMDTKHEMFTELEEIQGIVHHLLDLKNFKFEEESEQSPRDVDEAVLNKAVMIWRSSISQYLGRIKDLEEMLRLKWTRLVQEAEPVKKLEQIESELYEAFGEMENQHKDDVDCKLKIPCRECKRRGCASERFMLQVDFLISEINENFSKANHPGHV
jgi:hypothetical protein